ncbi:hypothetical protein Agub_g4418, partial [Astrephomene gubernaculifera]
MHLRKRHASGTPSSSAPKTARFKTITLPQLVERAKEARDAIEAAAAGMSGSRNGSGPAGSNPQPSLSDLMAAIQNLENRLDKRLEKIETRHDEMCTGLAKVQSRMDTLEGRLEAVEASSTKQYVQP